MPRVCADPQAFEVNAGSLALNWAAVGSTYAEAMSAPVTANLTGPTDGYVGPSSAARLAYTNNTTRRQVVRYSAHMMRVDMAMGPGNRWLAGLYLMHQMDTPPADTNFNAGDIATVRSNQEFGATGASRLTVPITSRTRHVVVDPGRTVHLMATVWRWIFVYTAHSENSLLFGPLWIEYDTSPSAI